jgi:arylsulfatase A-like enzyme
MRIYKILPLLTVLFIGIPSNTLFSQSQNTKPNVIFIMCDDLNDYQGVFGGHPQALTPNIDKLAASGVQFLNAQSNVPVCQPSRNSLFTGVYPHRSKDFGWTPILKHAVLKNNKTLIRLFKENGYKTLGTGKLTHGKPPKEWDEWGMNYRHNYGPFFSDGENRIALPTVPEPYASIGAVDGSYGRFSEAGISKGIKGEKGLVYGWDQKPFRYINDTDRDLVQDELHAKWAVQKLKELETEEQPFFMGIGFVRPHTPLHAPDKYFDLFPIDELELSSWMSNDTSDTHWLENFSEKKKGPKLYNTLLASYGGNREVALKHFLQAYLACVAFVDEQIGKVVDAIENSSLRKNTIIILTSDHGWQMGEKSYLFKNSPWEESTRVPLIINNGASTVKGKVTHPVSLIDLYPTLMDLCSLEGNNKLNEQGGALGGFSLRPFLESSKTNNWDGPNGALTLIGNYGKTIPTEKQNFSYRTVDYRYILYSNGKEELYDHGQDPYEWHNIAGLKKYDKIRKELRLEMEAILQNR